MDLLVVSQLRFSGPVPWVSASTGQSLLSCLYGPASSTASTGQLPLWSSLQFYGVGALFPVIRGWCPLSSSTGLVPSLQFYGVGALQFSGWRPPVLGLEPSSSRVGALAPAQSACRFAQNRHNDLTPEALSSASTAPKLCCCCTPRERSSKV